MSAGSASHGECWQSGFDGKCSVQTIEEIAEAENINPSYVSRVLRMTLLAPEIVEAILAGRQPEELTMVTAMRPLPVEWKTQRVHFCAVSESGQLIATICAHPKSIRN